MVSVSPCVPNSTSLMGDQPGQSDRMHVDIPDDGSARTPPNRST